MSRGHLYVPIIDLNSGQGYQNAAAYVYATGGTAAIAGTMYSDASAGSALTNPLISGAGCYVEAWLDTPQRVDVLITDNSNTAYFPNTPSSLESFPNATVTADVGPSASDAFAPSTPSGPSYVLNKDKGYKVDSTVYPLGTTGGYFRLPREAFNAFAGTGGGQDEASTWVGSTCRITSHYPSADSRYVNAAAYVTVDSVDTTHAADTNNPYIQFNFTGWDTTWHSFVNKYCRVEHFGLAGKVADLWIPRRADDPRANIPAYPGWGEQLSLSNHEHAKGDSFRARNGDTWESFYFQNFEDLGVVTTNGSILFVSLTIPMPGYILPFSGTIAKGAVSAVTLYSGATAMAGCNHLWVAAYDYVAGGPLPLLAQSTDAPGATWAANTPKTFTFATPVAGTGVPGHGMHEAVVFIAVMIDATQHPSLMGHRISHQFDGVQAHSVKGTSTGLTATAPDPEGEDGAFDSTARLYTRVTVI